MESVLSKLLNLVDSGELDQGKEWLLNATDEEVLQRSVLTNAVESKGF